MSELVAIQEVVEEHGLRYTHDFEPGISRVKTGTGFDYFGPKGERIDDPCILERIRSLAIPPAYQQVWICADPSGHLQATGKDARGRKQYRYHPRFRELQDESKFERMIEFAEALPAIHAAVDRDLAKRGFPKEKVLAAVVALLEKSFIRVGNEEYRKTNKSYGLTTLRNRHVEIQGSEIRFHFLGKSKVKHHITLKDRKLANVVKTLQELPGQELFQYQDENGTRHSVTSQDVNAYLHEVTGKGFSAKDFRTWAGTVLALVELASVEAPPTKTALKKAMMGAVKVVASQLGNTPSVCRKCYIHPAIISSYSDGSLQQFLATRAGNDDPEAVSGLIHCAEEVVIDLLKSRTPELKKAS